MTDQQVAATLRAATKQGLIVSWIHLPNGDWTIVSQVGGAHNHTWQQVRHYCRMLRQAGITTPCTGPPPVRCTPSPGTDMPSSTLP